MRFYYSPDAKPGHRWNGTQDDARRAQGGGGFTVAELADDKAGRLAFLNRRPVAPDDESPAWADWPGTPGIYCSEPGVTDAAGVDRPALDIGPALAATPAGATLKAEQAAGYVLPMADLVDQVGTMGPADLADSLLAALGRLGELGEPAIEALAARLCFGHGAGGAAMGAMGVGAAVARTLDTFATLKVSSRGPWPADQDIHRTPGA